MSPCLLTRSDRRRLLPRRRAPPHRTPHPTPRAHPLSHHHTCTSHTLVRSSSTTRPAACHPTEVRTPESPPTRARVASLASPFSRSHSPPSHLSPFFFQLPAVHLQILLHSVVLREQRRGITRGIGLALVEYARGQPKVVRGVRKGGAGECSVRCLGHGCFDQHAREVRRGGEPTPRGEQRVSMSRV